MGTPKEPQPARIFMSLIFSDAEIFQQALQELESRFGKTDFVSERFPFQWTDYYAKEMGDRLFRHFVTFDTLFPIPCLPEMKHTTNRMESGLADGERKRRVNIDPGYVCLQHVILATTKGYTHRPYLRDGIYADLTLVYRDSSYHPLEWTYPDYRHEKIILLFNQLRKKYMDTLRQGASQPC